MSPAELEELRVLMARAARKIETVNASCVGKHAFIGPDEARRAMRHPNLLAYHCQHCGLWHLGTQMTWKGRRRYGQRPSAQTGTE